MPARRKVALGHHVYGLHLIVPLLYRIEVPLDVQVRLVDIVAGVLLRLSSRVIVIVSLRAGLLGFTLRDGMVDLLVSLSPIRVGVVHWSMLVARLAIHLLMLLVDEVFLIDQLVVESVVAVVAADSFCCSQG